MCPGTRRPRNGGLEAEISRTDDQVGAERPGISGSLQELSFRLRDKEHSERQNSSQSCTLSNFIIQYGSMG